MLNVLSDKKIPTLAGSSLSYFNADIKAYNDYYPFGMLMPNRHANTGDYRYGFQGQEMDDEIKGEGNSLNYTFRMHDPRVGRFFAVDPLTAKYPHYSPYSFSGNKVIAFVELEGLEEYEANLLNGLRVRMFKVRGGDNLSVISKITGVAVSDIIKLNDFEGGPNLIYPNQSLVVDTNLASKIITPVNTPINKASESSYRNWASAFLVELATSNENGPNLQSQFFAATDPIGTAIEEFTGEEIPDEVHYVIGAYQLLRGKKPRSKTKTRTIDPDLPIKEKAVNISAIDENKIVKNHLKQFGKKAENDIMLKRMNKIDIGEIEATKIDINFKRHELSEAKYMKQGMTQQQAHEQTLKDQGMYHREYEKKLYTKEALEAGDAQLRKESDNGY